MIDLFIIHSGKNSDYVLETVVPMLVGNGKECHVNILLLGSQDYKEKYDLTQKKLGENDNFEVQITGKNWKKDAKKYIKRARAVLVVAGDDIETKKATIGFEVKYARKYGKLILVHKMSESVKIPDFLKEKDQFTGKIKNISEAKSLEQIRKRLDDFDIGYYDVFSIEKKDGEPLSDDVIERIMSQYTMYQKTSEDLVTRRQSVSSFYITVNGAIVTLAGLILGIVEFPNSLYIIFCMAVVGIILDVSWINILEAYGSLNAAKMKVISLLEKELPINLYDTEWSIMSDKLNKKKYVSFTDSEKRIPKIFTCIYIVMVIASVILMVL